MTIETCDQQGGTGEPFAEIAQLQEGSLRRREPLLLGAALARLDRPFEATQVGGCGGKFCDHARADVAPHHAGADSLVVVVIPFLASLFPRHVPLRDGCAASPARPCPIVPDPRSLGQTRATEPHRQSHARTASPTPAPSRESA